MKTLLSSVLLLISTQVFGTDIPSSCIVKKNEPIQTYEVRATVVSELDTFCSGTIGVGRAGDAYCQDRCSSWGSRLVSQDISHEEMIAKCEEDAREYGLENADYECKRQSKVEISPYTPTPRCIDNSFELKYYLTVNSLSVNGYKLWKRLQCQALESCLGDTRSERRAIRNYERRLSCSL